MTTKTAYQVEFEKMCAQFWKPHSQLAEQAYLESIGDLPMPEVIAAMQSLRQTGRYMPTASQIRGMCESEPDQASLAGEAWLLVLAAANRSELPDDPKARAAAHAIGLDGPTMGRMQGGTIEFERPRFIKAFAALADTPHAAKQIEAPKSRVEQIEEHRGLPDEARKAIASVLGR